jgi:multiple sugar transport system substrate-binding protein
MPHIRKAAIAAATVLSLGVALTACSGDGAPGSDKGGKDGDKIELTQWYHEYGEEGTKEAVERYADEYNKSQDKVHVTVTWIPGDYESKLNSALLAGEGPDIFDAAPVGERILAGQVLPLNDLFGDTLSDFNPKNLSAVTVDDQIYGVPMTDGTGLLFYRTSWLKDAGVEPPKTMDELIAAADKLSTKEHKGLFIGNDGCTSSQLPKIAVWSAGTEIINSDGDVVMDPDRTAVAFDKMAKLCNSDSLLMGAPADWYDSSSFIDGLTAMQWGGQWTLPVVQEALGDDFGVVPWPAADAQGKPATWYGGWYEEVNAASKNIDAAKDFVKWLWVDNLEAQTEWQTAFGSAAPVRISIAEGAEELSKAPAKTFIDAIADYAFLESGVWWTSPTETALADGLNNVVRNGADAKAEANKIVEVAKSEVERVKAGSKLK